MKNIFTVLLIILGACTPTTEVRDDGLIMVGGRTRGEGIRGRPYRFPAEDEGMEGPMIPVEGSLSEDSAGEVYKKDFLMGETGPESRGYNIGRDNEVDYPRQDFRDY